jgi:hypothetical protein
METRWLPSNFPGRQRASSEPDARARGKSSSQDGRKSSETSVDSSDKRVGPEKVGGGAEGVHHRDSTIGDTENAFSETLVPVDSGGQLEQIRKHDEGLELM